MKWLLYFLCLSASAATYYVDPAAVDDTKDGTTQGNAWAHVPGAVGYTGSGWASLVDGDTIYVKGGVTNHYNVLVDSAHYTGATSFDSIRIRGGDLIGWGTGKAIFDQGNTNLYGFALGGSGITLERLEIRNVKDGANAIWGNGSACIEIGSASVFVSNLRVTNCYLHTAYGTTTDHGFGVEWYGPDATGSACNSIIEGCTIENVRTKGIEVYGTNNIIRNNFITKFADHGIVASCTNSDFYNNLIVAAYPASGIAEVDNQFVHDPVYCLKINYDKNDVFNNVAFGVGIDNMEGFASHGSSNRFLLNTTAYFANADNWADNGANGINIGFEQANTTSGNMVQGNILYGITAAGHTGQAFFWDEAANLLVAYNDFFPTNATPTVHVVYGHSGAYTEYSVTDFDAATLSNGANANDNQAADPLFTKGTLPSGLTAAFVPNTSYFALGASSPAAVRASGNSLTSLPKNGAQASSKFGFDILGYARSGWSMGAYEYGVSLPVGRAVVGKMVVR